MGSFIFEAASLILSSILFAMNIFAMGTRPAPPYANIFMANQIDDKIKEAASKMKDCEEDSIKLLKHFLDDLFIIYFGSTKRLHNLLKEINKIHPNIKLTMSHTSIISEPNISKVLWSLP